MEFEADNTPSFRTVEEAYGHGARLHVPRNVVKDARQWALNAAATMALATFSILAVLAIIVLGLSAMDVVLGWVSI